MYSSSAVFASTRADKTKRELSFCLDSVFLYISVSQYYLCTASTSYTFRMPPPAAMPSKQFAHTTMERRVLLPGKRF